MVLATRAPSGRVTPGYGFPGGSSTWWDAGVLFAGFLGGWKARIALSLGMAAGLDADGLGRLYGPYGGGRARD